MGNYRQNRKRAQSVLRNDNMRYTLVQQSSTGKSRFTFLYYSYKSRIVNVSISITKRIHYTSKSFWRIKTNRNSLTKLWTQTNASKRYRYVKFFYFFSPNKNWTEFQALYEILIQFRGKTFRISFNF